MPTHARSPKAGGRPRTFAPIPTFPLLIAVIALAAPPALAESAAWRWPVTSATVTDPFTYDGARFAPGRHRGIDISAPTGTTVRSPCRGDVTFSGTVPRHGGAVTIRCGALEATLLGLARRANRGTAVAAGARVGSLRGTSLHLGARRARDYLDPLTLLPAKTPVHGPAPLAAPRRPRLRPPPPRPVPAAPRPAPTGTPIVTWIGLALGATAVPVGALVGRRRRVTSARPCPSTSPRRSTT